MFSTLLRRYDPDDQEIYLKARFLLLITLIAIIGLSVTLLYTSYTFGVSSTTVLVESIGFMIMLSALILVVRGNYFIAVHIILVTCFAVAWTLMFIEPVSSLLIKLDTIVFVIVIMAAMPMMFLSSRRSMLVYFAVNFGIFIYFNYTLVLEADMTLREHVDYALDNSISMVFVLIIAYNLFSIYQQTLNSLKNELRERKKAEGSLEKFQVFLSDIINSMPSGIIGVTMDATIVLWNREVASLTGLSREGAVEKSLFDVFPQLGDLKEKIHDVMTTESIAMVHKRTLAFSDGERFMDITIFPLFYQGAAGAVIRLDDISERLRMEEVIAQSEKMISIGGLAAGMAHEINNPLAGMIQNAQVILNRVSQPLPANEKAAQKTGVSLEKVQAYMEERGILKAVRHIHTSGLHAAGIIENMLSFARKSRLKKQPENLASIVEKTLDLARNDWDLNRSYDFKNLKISLNLDKDLPMVPCERSKIQQVLFNIIKNASEAMSSQDREPGTSELAISLFRKGSMARIEIRDNGPGMDHETRKRVFEPFFTTKGVDKGTGLGLSVSYFIISDDHNGTLDVESIPGKGTSFIIHLPF